MQTEEASVAHADVGVGALLQEEFDHLHVGGLDGGEERRERDDGGVGISAALQ